MLTNWYVRRSRRRFWDGTAASHATFDVFSTAFEALLRAIAPLLPFAAEEIWKSLTGGRSVHLEDFPDAAGFPQDEDLVAAMDFTRSVCSAGSALRKARNLRVRLALGEDFTAIIADELNVKSVRVLGTAEARDAGFSFERSLAVHARAAGPRLGKDVQQAIRGSKSGDWSVEDGVVTAGGIELIEGEYTLEERAESASESLALAPVQDGFIALETALTDELAAEGTARDAIRAIQGVRKQLALYVSDRIRVTLHAPEAVAAALSWARASPCAWRRHDGQDGTGRDPGPGGRDRRAGARGAR
jgi:isoleucyl-tRNA synthetase